MVQCKPRECVLVTFLSMWWNMTKATHNKFIWVCGSRGSDLSWWEAWQQAGGVVARAEARGSHLELQAWNRESNLKWWNSLNSQSVPLATCSPAMPHFINLPKERHQLETRCSHTWAHGGVCVGILIWILSSISQNHHHTHKKIRYPHKDFLEAVGYNWKSEGEVK